VAQFLTAAAQEGAIRQDLAIAEMAASFVNGWEGALLRMKSNGSPKPLESFIETIATILERGDLNWLDAFDEAGNLVEFGEPETKGSFDICATPLDRAIWHGSLLKIHREQWRKE
jgi:hypothetical protein